jgi:hypothetical protein
LPGEILADVLPGLVARAETRVVQLDAVAVKRGNLRDTRTHGACTDHGNDGVWGNASAMSTILVSDLFGMHATND